jgi:hypothetical protein
MLLILACALGMPVDLSVYRTSGTADSETYHYVLRNHTREHLHNFAIGTALSDSCPELQELPVGWTDRAKCPSSIVTPMPWQGCVTFEEECEGHFLQFDYPENHDGLAPGDSLRFSVTVRKGDPTYEQASFWIVSDEREYVGKARKDPGLTGRSKKVR